MSDRSKGGQKYIISHALGGLNDQFNQIAKGYEYSKASGRSLVVNTQLGGLGCPFDEIFETSEPSVVGFSTELASDLTGLSVAPARFQDTLLLSEKEANRLARSPEFSSIRPVVHGEVRRNKADFPEDVLVLPSWGGGLRSLETFDFIRLKGELADQVIDRLTQLPPNYAAVHIRHTDLRVDAKTAFKLLSRPLSDRDVVICTDHRQVLKLAKLYFNRSCRLHFMTEIPNNGSHGIHHGLNGYRGTIGAVVDTFTDLFALAYSKDLFCPRVVPIRPDGRISGFAHLASALRKDRNLLNKFLSKASPDKLKKLSDWVEMNSTPTDDLYVTFDQEYKEAARLRPEDKLRAVLKTKLKIGAKTFSLDTFLRRVTLGWIRL